MQFITPVEITPGSAGSWVEKDLSSYIPAGSTGVILHVYDVTGSSPRTFGYRKKGSTDNRTDAIGGGNHFWCAIGVDSNRKLELYIGNTTSMHILLVGYFGSEAVFFDNAVDKTPGTLDSWQDVNIATDTGSNTATAAIFECIQTGWGFGIRKNGSSDNRTDASGAHFGTIVGLDGSEICEAYLGDASPYQTVKLWLVGYMKAGFTSYSTASDKSLSTANAWTDLSALPSGALGAVIEVVGGSTGDYYGLRKNGSSEDIYRDNPNTHAFGIVEADSSQVIEGKIQTTDTDFYILGYFIVASVDVHEERSAKATGAEGAYADRSATVQAAGAYAIRSAKATGQLQVFAERGAKLLAVPVQKFGIIVSKPGKDVLNYESLDDLFMHSEYPLLKIHSYGTFETNILGEVEIEHNLGYRPYVLVFSQAIIPDFNTGDWSFSDQLYQHDWYTQGASYVNYGRTKIYDNKVVIQIGDTNSAGRPGVLQGFYYIFKDELV